ncbi:MAG TPA: hypothetical protein VFQ25_17390 [Ktedonobacterales bacterium]|nr:hypothetical protein [Ktedonobacterales bacterium]
MTPPARKDRPGYEQEPRPEAEPGALAALSADEIDTLALRLMDLDFGSEGLTRDQLRRRLKGLPEAVYLRLASSRRYHSATDILRAAGSAPSRSEGDFLGPHPDIPEAESLDDGGPPAWGGDPLLTLDGIEDSGSAEDEGGRGPGDEER